MAPWSSAALGLLLAAAVTLVILGSRAHDTAAAPTAVTAEPPSDPAPVDSESEPMPVVDAGIPAADVEPTFDVLPDGSPVPKLPDSAPKEVSFGVVLFQYAGAQGAPAGSRDRAQARALARETVPLAQSDFSEAVKQGDRGSTTDAGSVPRGVLEPAPEYLLFSLDSGEVSQEPIDTPTGYWVVRRQ
jgi:hypothetical protein